jgi:four helix bundle protein
MRSRYRDLDAHRLAFELARDLHRAVSRWDRFDRWAIGLQLVRAAGSIGANIAEGSGKWHKADERRMLFIARGSLYETEHWMALASDAGLLPREESNRLVPLARTLNGLIKAQRR